MFQVFKQQSFRFIKPNKCIGIKCLSIHYPKFDNNFDNKLDKPKQTNINNGKYIFYRSLLDNNVDTVFGYSGGSVMPLIDAFYKSEKIKLIVNSNEQCLGHSACGYAKSSNKVGVCIVTSGPGITNLITPILDATNDSTPMVIISGQVPLTATGTNAFQEAPAVELTKHVTKWSYQLDNINDMDFILDKAFEIAKSGKPGAVHIDIPKCVSYQEINIEEQNYQLLQQKRNKKIEKSITYNDKYNNNTDVSQISFNDRNYIIESDFFDYKKVSHLINMSLKPIIYVGQGCKDASEELKKLSVFANIPVVSTIHGVGIMPDKSSLSLRWCGMHGYAPANYALQDADLIIAIGSRFDDRTTGNLEKYAPVAREASREGTGGIIHCNINPNELDFVVKSDYNFCMDSSVFIKKLLPFVRNSSRFSWFNYIKLLKKRYPFELKKSDMKIHMEHVLDTINNLTSEWLDLIITTGVGNHQMQTYQFINSNYPGKIISSGSLGVMGAGLPYAIGAQLANPDKTILCIDGDGSFNMTLSDLKTIAEYNLPIKIAIMNNNSQMMVTVWEKLFFNKRYTATINEQNPNYANLAESFGIKGLRCDNVKDLEENVKYFLDYKDGPILMEFMIEKDICLPLVKPGSALDDMVLPGNETFDGITKDGLVPS